MKNEKEESFVKNLIIDILIAVLLAGAVLYFIRPTVVQQSSMEETMHQGDYIIMYQRAYKKNLPERGDIIIFQSSLPNEINGGYKLLIKRIVGLPGDEISIKGTQLYINGKAYHEDYLKDGKTYPRDIPQEGKTYTVPDGMYFVMGDNRWVSLDSRSSEVGCVALDQIKGKAVFRLYPFDKVEKF